MGLLSLEHGRAAYRADFVVYGALVSALAAFLLLRSPPARGWTELSGVLMGLAIWTILEYGLHRFVLHKVQPFRRWHAAHHLRPKALIGLPTLASAGLFAVLVFAPAWGVTDLPRASALTLGVLAGYLAYAVAHHAAHHWHGGGPWLRRHRRWHAMHHRHVDSAVCFGVTNGFWDRVFGTQHRAVAPARPATETSHDAR